MVVRLPQCLVSAYVLQKQCWQDCQKPTAVMKRGDGRYPAEDPWGHRFSSSYYPHRAGIAGQPIAAGFRAVVDGFQGDQEWVKKMFSLTRAALSCHVISSWQYVFLSAKIKISGDYNRKECCCYCKARWATKRPNQCAHSVGNRYLLPWRLYSGLKDGMTRVACTRHLAVARLTAARPWFQHVCV